MRGLQGTKEKKKGKGCVVSGSAVEREDRTNGVAGVTAKEIRREQKGGGDDLCLLGKYLY